MEKIIVLDEEKKELRKRRADYIEMQQCKGDGSRDIGE